MGSRHRFADVEGRATNFAVVARHGEQALTAATRLRPIVPEDFHLRSTSA